MPSIFTLAETAANFSDKLGRQVSESDILESCLECGGNLHAIAPAELYPVCLSRINGNLVRFPFPEADFLVMIEKFRAPSIARGLALLRPHHIQTLLVHGEVSTNLPAEYYRENDDQTEWWVFNEPARVRFAEVRILPDTVGMLFQLFESPETGADDGGEKIGDDSHDARLAELFDPVPVQVLERLFPDGGKWTKYAERAARNKLSTARVSRGQFNPYRAAVWWASEVGIWDLERCMRKLANNLPARSKDSKHMLTGEPD